MKDERERPTPATSESAEPDYGTLVPSAWSDLQRLAATVERPDLVDPLRPAVERFELGVFRLVVMGEIKKGKSSFLNALLAEPDLLPTASDVATSTVYKVLYGPAKKFKVFFLRDVDSGRSPPLLVIRSDELAAYGTEAGNPANRRRVDFIGVELPNPMLKNGLVLVDTPGVGGLFKSHRDITWRYAPNADAIFFVLDSVEAVISSDEIQFLQELTAKVTKRVYFVQTKTDVADTEQWQAWRDRNLDVLAAKLVVPREQLLYFPVSCNLKAVADRRHSGRHLNDSGFLPVLDFLHRGLMQTKRRQSAYDLARLMLGATRHLRQELAERARIAQAGAREGLERIGKEYTESRREFEDWQRTTFQRETRTFSTGLADLKRRALLRLQEELDPMGPIVEQILDNLRKNAFDPRAVNETAGQIQQECLARASEVVGKVHGDFNREVTQLIETAARRLSQEVVVEQLRHEVVAPGCGQPSKIGDTLNVHFSQFDDVRNALYGGMAGVMIAHIGVGLVSLLFPPAAAMAAIANLIGVYVGWSEADKSATARRRDEVIAKLSGVLQNLMRKAQRQALGQFNEITTSYERRAEEVLRSAAETQQAVLQNRLQSIEEARSRTSEENQGVMRSLEAAAKDLARVEVSLAPLTTAPAEERPTP